MKCFDCGKKDNEHVFVEMLIPECVITRCPDCTRKRLFHMPKENPEFEELPRHGSTAR